VLFSLEAVEAPKEVENENLPLVAGLKTEVQDNAEVEEAKNRMEVDVNDLEMVGEGGGRLEKRKRFVHPGDFCCVDMMDPEIAGHFYDISQKTLVELRNQAIALKKRINQLKQKPGETIKSKCEDCKVCNFQEINKKSKACKT
jgi:hypothetical protein